MLFRVAFIALCLALAAPLAWGLDKIVAADNLALQAGPTLIHIPRITLEETPLSSADLARLFDAKDPASLSERLARFTAARVRIPEVRGESDAGEQKKRFIYKDLTLEAVDAGRIGSARAASLEEALERKDDVITARYDKFSATGVDLPQLAHALAPRAEEMEVAKPLAEAAGIESLIINAKNDAFSMRAAHIGASGVRMRAFSAQALRAMTQIESRRLSETESDAAALALGLVDAIEFGALEAHDLTLSGRAAPSDKPYAIGARNLALKSFAAGAARETLLEGFTLQSADGGRLAFERLAFNGLDFARAIQRAGPRALHFDSANLSGLTGDLPDPDGGGRLKFALNAAGAELANFRDGAPTKAALRFEGFKIDLAARGDEANAKLFRALGYAALELSGGVDAEWREATREFNVARLRLDAKDMGALTLGANFSGVDGAVFTANPLIAGSLLLTARLTRFEATLEGAKLIDRLLAQSAKESGAEPVKLRADYARDMGKAILAELGESDKARRIAAAVESFIASPKRLHLTLAAPKGVGALDLLKSLPEILQEMEVEATAE